MLSVLEQNEDCKVTLLPEHPHTSRPPILRHCQLTTVPAFLCDKIPKVIKSFILEFRFFSN